MRTIGILFVILGLITAAATFVALVVSIVGDKKPPPDKVIRYSQGTVEEITHKGRTYLVNSQGGIIEITQPMELEK